MQTIKASLRKIDIVVEQLCKPFGNSRTHRTERDRMGQDGVGRNRTARNGTGAGRDADGTRGDGTGRDNTERDGTGWDRRHGTEQDGTGIEYRSVRASLITINAKNEQSDFQAMPSP